MALFFQIIPLFCLLTAFGLLVTLTVIDLREFLLPDRYVFPFGFLGLLFHGATGFTLLSVSDSLTGAALGGLTLLVIRWLGSRYYKQEAMGLGDVKLMTAAGFWLGPASIMMAMTIGATAGLAHGLIIAIQRAVKTRTPVSLHRLVIPAGPGFIVGIIAMIVFDHGRVVLTLLHGLFS